MDLSFYTISKLEDNSLWFQSNYEDFTELFSRKYFYKEVGLSVQFQWF